MRAAAIQMTSGRDVALNLEAAGELVATAAGDGAKLVVLPENFSFLGATDAERLAAAEAPGEGPAQTFLAEQALRHAIWLVGGTIPIAAGDGRVRSRSLLLGPDGGRVAAYDKIHLFDVRVPDNEAESYRESATTEPGTEVVAVETPLGCIGMTVCYDLRFPGLFRALAQAGAEFITVPSSFQRQTGKAHWHTLVRARAIENECFVIAPAMCGDHPGNRQSFGHTLVIDPWGEVLAEGGESPEIIYADVVPRQVAKVRSMIPSLEHDRPFTRPDQQSK